ncbi:unnamed protein product [Aphanomyces euteiches]
MHFIALQKKRQRLIPHLLTDMNRTDISGAAAILLFDVNIMESLFGIVGKDFVIVGADSKVARSILVYKDDEDKVFFDGIKRFHEVTMV